MNAQQLQLVQTAYPNQSHDTVLSAASTQQLLVHSICAYNATSSAIGVGVGHSFNSNYWKLWQNVASVYSNVTATVQAGSSTTLFTTTSNDGFIVQAKEKFGLVSFVVSQTQTGSPVHSYQYWDGSTWQTLTLFNTPSYASTGKKAILFTPPIDWAVGAGSLGPDETFYSVRVRATTGPSQAVKVSAMKVCRVVAFRNNIAADQQLQVLFDTRQLLLQQGESVIGFFETANAANSMEVSYQINP